MKKTPPRDCLSQTRTARLRTLPACVDAARLIRSRAAKHRGIAAAGLASMLAAGHKGRALMGGLPDAGVQRGCQDGVQVQDGAQGQGEVQDRSFEAEHATTRPKWVWRHFTPTPCTNEMSVWKSLPCERVSGKQFREIIPADKGR